MIGSEKIVLYDQYCKKCAHWTKREYEDPCYDCLNTPVNEDSHKPVNFKEPETKKKA